MAHLDSSFLIVSFFCTMYMYIAAEFSDKLLLCYLLNIIKWYIFILCFFFSLYFSFISFYQLIAFHILVSVMIVTTYSEIEQAWNYFQGDITEGIQKVRGNEGNKYFLRKVIYLLLICKFKLNVIRLEKTITAISLST